MNVTNITAIVCDENIDLNATNDYINITKNCTNFDNKNINVKIPTVLPTIPCGLSFLYLMSLMIYVLFKPFLTNK